MYLYDVTLDTFQRFQYIQHTYKSYRSATHLNMISTNDLVEVDIYILACPKRGIVSHQSQRRIPSIVCCWLYNNYPPHNCDSYKYIIHIRPVLEMFCYSYQMTEYSVKSIKECICVCILIIRNKSWEYKWQQNCVFVSTYKYFAKFTVIKNKLPKTQSLCFC